MATQTADIVETVSIGRILSRTGAVLAANPVTMFGIAFVFGAIPAVLVSWFQVSLRTSILDRYQMMGVIAVAIVAGIVSMVFYALVQGALPRATIAQPAKTRKSVVEGKSVAVRVDFGGSRIMKKKIDNNTLRRVEST